MRTPLDSIIGQLEDHGVRLLKAIPRDPGQLNLELVDTTGQVRTGWWFRDRSAGSAAVADVRSVAGHDCARRLGGSGIVLLQPGTDPRLPALRDLLARPGVRLVTHRLQIRAVIREADGRFTKVVRPRRAARIASAFLNASMPNVAVPRLTQFDVGLGTVTIAALPGQTLHARLANPAVSDEDVALDAKSVGAAVRELHQQPPPTEGPQRGAADALTGSRRWLGAATDHGLITEDRWRDGLRLAGLLLGGLRPQAPTMVHGDLHEKQLLLARGRPVGLLDLDELGPGDPALDVGNLLAHLQLRVLQARIGPGRARMASRAFLEGYAPDPDLLSRLPGYLLVTRLRLAAVYAFRAAPEDLVAALLRPDQGSEALR